MAITFGELNGVFAAVLAGDASFNETMVGGYRLLSDEWVINWVIIVQF